VRQEGAVPVSEGLATTAEAKDGQRVQPSLDKQRSLPDAIKEEFLKKLGVDK
ncbi:hypothetical protein LTR66_016580, partial [Elasticomyces elasticus]